MQHDRRSNPSYPARHHASPNEVFDPCKAQHRSSRRLFRLDFPPRPRSLDELLHQSEHPDPSPGECCLLLMSVTPVLCDSDKPYDVPSDEGLGDGGRGEDELRRAVEKGDKEGEESKEQEDEEAVGEGESDE